VALDSFFNVTIWHHCTLKG